MNLSGTAVATRTLSHHNGRILTRNVVQVLGAGQGERFQPSPKGTIYMTFTDAVKMIVSTTTKPMTPQEIRDHIKKYYPDFYGTEAHIKSVKRGHCKNADHALLAHIYTLVRTNKTFSCNKNSKPMKISLIKEDSHLHPRTLPSHGSQDRRISSLGLVQYEHKVRDILVNAEKYHQSYYKAETFRGPSLYFHQRALETRHEPGSLTHLEYVYATLASWGMHRMGKKGSKMQGFDAFRISTESLLEKIFQAQKYDYREMDDIKWSILESIFRGINIMASGTSIVGNSKVMHHMLPNIVPPIDREYTLWYLRGNTNIKNDLNYEWQLMKEIISRFFIPVAADTEFASKASTWISRKNFYPWDTSILKVVDNLIIGSKK